LEDFEVACPFREEYLLRSHCFLLLLDVDPLVLRHLPSVTSEELTKVKSMPSIDYCAVIM
jgi:hypothetical protein